MFKTPEPVNPEFHARLKLSLVPDYRYAATQLVTPFVSGEMWQVAREFIAVFGLQADDLPLAILGTEAGVNSYVGDGRTGTPAWWGRYVPAHLRRYPFILAPRTQAPGDAPQDQRFTLCLDRSAAQLNGVEGRPLFTADGQPAELLQEVQQALLGLQQDWAITQALVRQIDAAGLLVEQPLTVPRAGREPVAFNGFRVVDQGALRACPPDVLAELARTRALDLVYAHIASLSNVQDGLLAKKAAGPLPDAAPPAVKDFDIDALLAGDGGTFQFNFSQ